MILTKTFLPVIPMVCQYAKWRWWWWCCGMVQRSVDDAQWMMRPTGAGSVVQGQRCMVSGAAAVCSCLQSCSCIATAVMLVMPDFYTIVTMLLDKFEISWIAIDEIEISWIAIDEIKASNVPFLQSWPTEEFVVFMIDGWCTVNEILFFFKWILMVRYGLGVGDT